MYNNAVISLEMFEEAKEYWLDKLVGDLNELSLPADFSTHGKSGKGIHKISFGNELTGKLNHISKNNDLAIYVVLLTVLKILLFRFTGQKDIAVSASTLKDSSQDYNKRVVLLDFLDERMTFKEILANVKETFVDCCKYQYYPIDILIRDLKLSNPLSLFKIVFLMETIHKEMPGEETGGDFQTDIVFSISKKNNGLAGNIAYNARLYKPATIQAIFDCYIYILTQVLDNTGIKIIDMELITEIEKKRILLEFNNTKKVRTGDRSLHGLFEEQVKRSPDSIAVIYKEQDSPDTHITYRELDEKANQMARILKGKGVKQEVLTGIMVNPSIDMMVGILGILKAGGAYLPIDTKYPEERIKFMLKDSNANVLLTQGDLLSKCEAIHFHGSIMNLDEGRFYMGNKENLESVTTPGNLVYVMYTSGSQGKPKGVLVENKNVIRLVHKPDYINFYQGDKLLLTGVIGFDITTFEIWAPLLNGLRLYLADENVVLDPGRLGRILLENGISLLHLSPQLFNQLALRRIDIFAPLKYLLVGGDLVSPRYINEVRKKFKDLKILHMYGPTENTTFSTFFLVDKDYEMTIPIGAPISNSTAYILDKNYKLLPIGVCGELYVGGDGVSRGYLNNPGLTAEKFIDKALSSLLLAHRGTGTAKNTLRGRNQPGASREIPGAKLYKTGDLARWLPDGNLEFSGRHDDQIKIRGVRIEPGEIETRLLKHNNIDEAIIISKEDKNGDKCLCAYIAAGKKLEVSELRAYLSIYLPGYMIPSYFIQIEEVPLTPNGKVDRKALPQPGLIIGEDYVPPRNEIEKKLVELWAEVLGIEKEIIGIDSNFFQLGGHSLKAAILVSLVHEELNLKIPIVEIFKTPTIRRLAEYLQGAEPDRYLAIKPVEKKEYYGLSSAQKRLYFLNRVNVDKTTYNLPNLFAVPAEIDREKLEKILTALIERHESLRTSFEIIDGEPVQRIHDQVKLEIEYYEENSFPGQPAAISIESIVRPFDLSRAPLLRIGTVKTSKTGTIVLIDVHHIILDEASHYILEKEFALLSAGKGLTPLRLQYKDFTAWQNNSLQSGEIRKQKEFWLETFKGEIPDLNFPIDFIRPAVQGFEGDTVEFKIDKEISAKIKQICIDTDTTVFMFLLASYNIILSRYTVKEDVVVGFPVHGRSHLDLQNIAGMFVNMLPLRNFPKKNKTFKEFLLEVKQNSIETFENQDYPFEKLVTALDLQNDLSRNPLFDVVFSMHVIDANKVGAAAAPAKAYKIERKTAKFDLMLSAFEDKNNDIIPMALEYKTTLFGRSTVKKMSEYYVDILKQTAANIDIEIGNISITHDLIAAYSSIPEEDQEGFVF